MERQQQQQPVVITEADIEEQCQELFSEPPIDFEPRPGNKLEEKMDKIIKDNNITIPVINVKDNIYLVGSEKTNCDLKAENVTIRKGVGYKAFTKYVKANEKYHQKILVSHMINNDESVEWVVDQLIQGKKMKMPIPAMQHIKITRPKSPTGIKRSNAEAAAGASPNNKASRTDP